MKDVYYGGFYEDPSLMIAVVLDFRCWEENKYICGRDKGSQTFDSYMCLGMAALNISYEAKALGIDCCFLTLSQKNASKTLKLKKEDTCPLIVGLGYEKKGSFQKKRERKPLSELVSYEYMGGKK